MLPGILKTNTLGYDGHGQFVLNSLDDIKKDWCFTADYILEKKVDFVPNFMKFMDRFNLTEILSIPSSPKIFFLFLIKEQFLIN